MRLLAALAACFLLGGCAVVTNVDIRDCEPVSTVEVEG